MADRLTEPSTTWRALAWLPIASPIAAALLLLLWPGAWEPFFGKERISEHQTHLLLAVAAILFALRYARERLPADLLFALGTLVVLAEETDYGRLYLDGSAAAGGADSFHNTGVGIVIFLLLPTCFALLPFALPASSWIRRRWFPVPRAAAAGVGACVVLLAAVQLTDAEVAGYPLREGADEIHDLGVTLALLVTAVYPRMMNACRSRA